MEELRAPQVSHQTAESTYDEPQTIHTAAFVTQVINQFQPAPQISAKSTAQSYESASAVGRHRGPWLSAII